jgi:potassium voltage-gated channel Eag-related subfamily H protein 7
MLIYILHFFGCLWYGAIIANIHSNENWVNSYGITDSSMDVKYFSAVYWATVTCTTVGYGDITPNNPFELTYALTIIILGVGIFSYFTSNLISQFADLLKTKAKNAEKISDFLKI